MDILECFCGWLIASAVAVVARRSKSPLDRNPIWDARFRRYVLVLPVAAFAFLLNAVFTALF
jgi:hypothetical protein